MTEWPWQKAFWTQEPETFKEFLTRSKSMFVMIVGFYLSLVLLVIFAADLGIRVFL